MSYKLKSAIEQHQENSVFVIPSPRDIANLKKGDHAQLIFVDEKGVSDRLWVEVTEVKADGSYEGVLLDTPAPRHLIGIAPGAIVVFTPGDVVDTVLNLQSRVDDLSNRRYAQKKKAVVRKKRGSSKSKKNKTK